MPGVITLVVAVVALVLEGPALHVGPIAKQMQMCAPAHIRHHSWSTLARLRRSATAAECLAVSC